MKSILLNTNFIILCLAGYLLINIAAAQSGGISHSQGSEMIEKLNATYKTLKAWSEDNSSKARKLESYFIKENSREESNSSFQYKDAWKSVQELNQNSMLLLEASYAFAKNTESAAGYSEDSIRSEAWLKCLKSDSCNFRKLNRMIDNEALSVSAQTKEKAIKTQQLLLESIDKLNEFSMQSEESLGLNDSIDTLSKVNATQANALVQLTAQISDLNRISSSEITKNHEKEKIKEKADELFLRNDNNTKSRHLDVTM